MATARALIVMPALALQVHVVEELLAELAHGDRPGLEQELVGQRALAVVDVGDDREVADELGVEGHGASEERGLGAGRRARRAAGALRAFSVRVRARRGRGERTARRTSPPHGGTPDADRDA
jgi:hypothetical protein